MVSARAPRILLLTRNLPPLLGGMERLNWHMASELSSLFEVHIIGPEGCGSLAPKGVEVSEVPLRPLSRFLLGLQWQALRLARRWRPQIVLAGSGLTALPAVLVARACGARSVVYVHGLDLAEPHPLYRWLWRPALRRAHRVIANSTPTAALAKAIGVGAERIGIVHPGVEWPDTEVDAAEVRRFHHEHQIPDGAPILLSVGRLTERKGLREFVSRVLPQIAAKHPDVILLIVGSAPIDALHASAQTPDSIREAAEVAGVARCLRFVGEIRDYRRLGTTYRAADVHVFPVREVTNDPEGFGMVAVEAAAHGLPTVAFSTGGVVEAVRNEQSGLLVPPGDDAGFAQAVLRLLAQPLPSDSITAHARGFVWSAFRTAMEAQIRLALP